MALLRAQEGADVEQDVVVHDGTTEGLRAAYEVSRRGGRVLCPQCGADLIVALDFASANRHKVHTGIYCPRSRSHVCELIEIRPRGANR
jgi:hypothetical protein